jgi:hypothetical protein
MAAEPGNQYALKLNTPELKKAAYDSFCSHLAKGKSKNSWTFKHPEVSLSYRQFQEYLKNEQDFPPIQQDIAISDGYYIWEEIVEESAKGINERANTASLQMKMRNMYGWDKTKEEKSETEKEPLQIERINGKNPVQPEAG